MHARLVRPDATTEAVSLPAGTAAAEVIRSLTGCDTLAKVHLVRPGPRGPGVDLWLRQGVPGSRPPLNPAAEAIAAFLSGNPIRQDFAGLAVFTGGPDRKGQVTALTSDYDQIVTTIAGQLRPRQGGSLLAGLCCLAGRRGRAREPRDRPGTRR